ncbi:hypothetical protein [Flavihumibacter petaseus]|uniref:Lipoprotein n=1 Tax=Flavihumibacter petaseus NBRC 106054 TaxID=1220578 RepID=A0A0E9N4K3_9BACT|nr:hypothetical protein [Flavihumibacter petaseus]GAO44728.1 hypothetical protein FPE01S_03_07670 [Flavihumibacter petaseus NBRC 106054]
MLKFVTLSIVLATSLSGCKEKPDKNSAPEQVLTLMTYFDSSRLAEFDTVSFTKNIPRGSNFWMVTDGETYSYTYQHSFPGSFFEDYTFPVADSMERIWISNHALFVKSFPLKVELPDKNLEMIMNGNGLIDISVSLYSMDCEEKAPLLYSAMDPKALFAETNPFGYFRKRSKTMDSLGVEDIGGPPSSMGNYITLQVKGQPGYFDYLPGKLVMKDSYRHYFDSVVATAKRINEHWIWRK